MSANTNALNWFEISVTNIGRAKKFYETIFEIEMHSMDMSDTKMAVFPPMGDKSGGALAQSSYHQPSAAGSLIYLNANPDLQLVLNRIENAGGKVVMPKTQISPEIGFMAMFNDTEGNLVALHSQS